MSARPLRLAGAIHHVVAREPGGRPILVSPAERQRFDRHVGGLLAAHGARAHAYCWMSNHVHLAVEIEPGRAVDFQGAIAAACGLAPPATPPLRVDAQKYLLHLVRYIHLNPVEAGLVADPLDYPWSGHGVYLGRPGVPWLATDHVLRLLGGDLLWATAAYGELMRPGWPLSAAPAPRTGR